jgi:hypothetical protein
MLWKKEWFEYGDEKLKVHIGISSAVLRTARNNLKEALLIDFTAGGGGYRVKSRYKILTPNQDPIPAPNHESLHYNKTKTKTNNNHSKNERFSKREFVTSGSDFDE